MAVLRIPYRLARIPLRVVEDIAASRLDEQAPARLTYEQFLVDCDRAAGVHLGDESAAVRAEHLRRHLLAVRLTIALRQRRVEQRREAEGAARMARWAEWQQRKKRVRAAKGGRPVRLTAGQGPVAHLHT